MKDHSEIIEEEKTKLLRVLNEAMSGSKLSLRKWAELINIGPSALSQILKGERDPRLSTYAQILAVVRRRREEE